MFGFIDIHMHIMGAALSGAGGNHNKNHKIAGVRSILGLLCREADNWKEIANGMKEFRREIVGLPKNEYELIAVSQIMDLAYTPLKRGGAGKPGAGYFLHRAVHPSHGATIRGQGDGKYYASDETVYDFRQDGKYLLGCVNEHNRLRSKYSRDNVELYAFVPFDPRRPNSVDLAKKMMKSPVAKGVKLYSRCGWCPDPAAIQEVNNIRMYGHPTGTEINVRLTEFYDWVTRERIPILVHTSPTGWPGDGELVYPISFINNFRSYNNHGLDELNLYNQITTSPMAWRGVIKDWPNIKLCFAHTGSSISMFVKWPSMKLKDKETKKNAIKLKCVNTSKPFRGGGYKNNWFDEILDLIMKSSNIYCDLSYLSSFEEDYPLYLNQIKRIPQPVHDKIMLGTDWYLTFKNSWQRDQKQHLEKFFINFVKGGDTPKLIQYSYKNAKRFLGI